VVLGVGLPAQRLAAGIERPPITVGGRSVTHRDTHKGPGGLSEGQLVGGTEGRQEDRGDLLRDFLRYRIDQAGT
jgi:hypothetical protein